MMLQNFMNSSLAPGQLDQNSVMEWLQQNGYDAAPMAGNPPLMVPGGQGQPGLGIPGVHYDPTLPQGGAQPGQQPQQPRGPDASLNGWDGVNDKLRYLAQRAQARRLAQPGQHTSGTGGGGGGFGGLLHTLFGGGAS